MASGNNTFPPQSQKEQPGLEYIMNPRPQFANPDYKPSNKLSGKVALVTGGDSGIGRSVCYHFVMEGATVAFTYVKGPEDRDMEETLQILQRVKRPEAKDPIAIPTDLGLDENCKQVVDQVMKAFGQIDILVNNAALQFVDESVEDFDPELIEKVFRTNIFSHFFMIRHAVRHMKAGSSIINTTSVNAYHGHSQLLVYSSTKGAVVGLIRALALRLAERGIRINGVAPGPIWTPLTPATFKAEEIPSFGTETTMGRAGQPYEIAPSFVFLASNADSSYVTGQVLHPNGGSIVNA
ncbi:glucose and ribitol dehydrogenase-like isoform X2 [Malania oleifera]|uniref:glucose and ribitol dehydrogenase-like isoform X2 n=1 Tax=Malania oleifera TaxID=397392 RepID=UPI0025AE654C|nr:glucose and ribitol dehydrogenase-like isoform X2 [Malania oleifera]